MEINMRNIKHAQLKQVIMQKDRCLSAHMSIAGSKGCWSGGQRGRV